MDLMSISYGLMRTQVHSSLPACLGAKYPDFIRYDGTYDPKYGIQSRLMPTRECWPPQDEADTLRDVFREVSVFFQLSHVLGG